ncbi:MAG: hypothetical protein KGI34_17740 [Bradyrhizobium sp.]|nr:hypothetical protein [Bradyrhizobium sp.]
MRLVFVTAAMAVMLLCMHHASAFSTDSSFGTAADGSSNYADPDEQIRSMWGGKDDDNHDLGYDAKSHRMKQPAQEIINGQGVLIPLTVPSSR